MFSMFRRKAPPPSKPTIVPDSTDEPPQMTILKTLVIVYDPLVEQSTGKKLSEYMHWNKVQELAKGYMSDILQASGGLVRHQIVQRIDVDAFPVKADGYVYDAETYLNVM